MTDEMPALEEDSEMEFYSPPHEGGDITSLILEKPSVNSKRSTIYNHLRQDFEQMNFGQMRYIFKKEARSLGKIGPLHFMILKLEDSEDFEDRINLIRNIESMIRLPRPMIQLFLIKLDAHILVSKIILGESNSQTSRTEQLQYLTDELNIACFDFIGELVKSNKRCFAMFEI
jgi:hypothetical protein